MTHFLKFDFPTCKVEWIPELRMCVTEFADGTQAHACPHETAEYRKHATEKSNGDIDIYCWQHDCFHVIYGLLNGGVSKVLWNLAHGLPTDTEECQTEEREVQEMQRRFYLRASE